MLSPRPIKSSAAKTQTQHTYFLCHSRSPLLCSDRHLAPNLQYCSNLESSRMAPNRRHSLQPGASNSKDPEAIDTPPARPVSFSPFSGFNKTRTGFRKAIAEISNSAGAKKSYTPPHLLSETLDLDASTTPPGAPSKPVAQKPNTASNPLPHSTSKSQSGPKSISRATSKLQIVEISGSEPSSRMASKGDSQQDGLDSMLRSVGFTMASVIPQPMNFYKVYSQSPSTKHLPVPVVDFNWPAAHKTPTTRYLYAPFDGFPMAESSAQHGQPATFVLYNSINLTPAFRNYSFEELRVADCYHPDVPLPATCPIKSWDKLEVKKDLNSGQMVLFPKPLPSKFVARPTFMQVIQ
jgi:hypothetical protein